MIGSLARTFRPCNKRWPGIVAFAAAFLLVTVLFANFATAKGEDWANFFRPAALNLRAPYSVDGVFNPPWTFLILAPLAWLPSHVGAAVLASFTLAVLVGYVKDWYKVAALMLSAPTLAVLYFEQIDVIPLLALLSPTWMALPLLMIKPQGVFLAALRRLNRTSIAVLFTVVAISFLVWGLWPLGIRGTPDGPHNRSLFPWSLGLTFVILLWLKVHPNSEHADGLLCLASVAACPYWAIHSMLPMTALFIKGMKSRAACFGICAATWGYALLTQQSG